MYVLAKKGLRTVFTCQVASNMTDVDTHIMMKGFCVHSILHILCPYGSDFFHRLHFSYTTRMWKHREKVTTHEKLQSAENIFHHGRT